MTPADALVVLTEGVMKERARIVSLIHGMPGEKQEAYLRANDRKLTALSVLEQVIEKRGEQ